MAFKFPFTNYHELNLTWVLEQLKKLFEESEENVETIETYDDRLSAVESEVSTLETTTSQAINTANAAATNAATALSRANTANENALTAGSQAGAAVTAAQGALQEAQAATQAAQQAQATAMTFDGRITQAQNDASAAVQEAQSFENRVNAAINTANNAANTATIAQGIAVNANQTAAQALDELNAQRDELVAISEEQQEAIEETAERVIASIPSDYTQLSADVKNKAPLILANASGDVASFKDGADDMEIRHLLATITPIQAGTGEPSPSNVRPISGRTSLSGARTGKNLFDVSTYPITEGKYIIYNTGGITSTSSFACTEGFIPCKHLQGKTVTLNKNGGGYTPGIAFYSEANVTSYISGISDNGATAGTPKTFTVPTDANYMRMTVARGETDIQLELGSTATDYEAYISIGISVNWQTEAGTVYGGMLDIVTGLLTVTMITVDMGSLSWDLRTNTVNPYFRYSLSGKKPNVAPLCSIYKTLENVTSFDYFGDNADNYTIAGSVSNNYIGVRDDRYNTAESFKTALSGVPLVYAVLTPQTVQLDPVTVKTLLGYNNIYTDCGPVSVDYPADTKLYIDGKFAELQALVLEH